MEVEERKGEMKTEHATLGQVGDKWVATVYSKYKNQSECFPTKGKAITFIKVELKKVRRKLADEQSNLLGEWMEWVKAGK